MFLDGFTRAEPDRFRQVETDELRLPTLVVDPFLHDLFVADDFDPGLERVEWHAGKPFRMKLAQLILIVVIIRRPENDATHSTLSDESVFTFGRFRSGAFGLIKRSEMTFQH